MHTISMLRRTLGLSSDNQVRNRMERIKDLLSEHIRRGPNNQIFLTDPGLDLLKQFQEVCDTGLTLAEASQVIRATALIKDPSAHPVSLRSVSNDIKPDQSTSVLASTLQEEMVLLRKQLASLQHQRSAPSDDSATTDENPWWTYLREDVDVT